MFTIAARNVHQALPAGLDLMRREGVLRHSRNGDVCVLPCPLTTIYLSPQERVMRWVKRDANPFFHFFEALWMLAGRNDVAFVKQFNSNIASYSDDGETFHGAYGHRWRQHWGYDQLDVIIRALNEDENDRRNVLQIWDNAPDLGSKSKDVPCNTQVFFQVNVDGQLDIMVTNRSNDMIWGTYGANAVHFAFLMEYVATALGRPMGAYYQASMNTHLYTAPHGWMLDEGALGETPDRDLYADEGAPPVRLVSLPRNRWDRELDLLLKTAQGAAFPTLDDPFLEAVAKPLWEAWREFKAGGPGRVARAQQALLGCAAADWHQAAYEWLERRVR